MNSSTSDITQVKCLGWLQGSVLSTVLVEKLEEDKLITKKAATGSIAIVISHSCDLGNDSLVKEPFAELLVGAIAERDPALEHGKSPRVFQIAISGVGTVNFSIHDRIVIPREYLTIGPPVAQLEETCVVRLRRWVALRYVRAAFPDAFNSRLRKVNDKLRRSLKKSGSKISGIYLDVIDDELAPTESYEISAWALMTTEDWENSDCRTAALEVVNEIQSALTRCDGVELIGDVQFMSESMFSLDDYNSLKRWDFDDLSLREDQALSHLPNP